MTRYALLAVSALAASAAAAIACNSDTVDIPGADAAPDAPPEARAPAGDAGDAGGDAPAEDSGSACAAELAHAQACNKTADLNCGVGGFVAWCKNTEITTDSDQRRRARAKCLTRDNCDGKKLKECIYRSYGAEQLTPAQRKLVEGYCATCAPGDGQCFARETTYPEALGPDGVTDVFLAAWELGEALTRKIEGQCTGRSLADAGPDAGTCAKRFGNCAGGLFIDSLPDCPK